MSLESRVSAIALLSGIPSVREPVPSHALGCGSWISGPNKEQMHDSLFPQEETLKP